MVEADAPTGIVTFLFTDIEGSTRLWDQHSDGMTKAMESHDLLLAQAADECGGYVFSQAGDGWGIAFSSPSSAIEAALVIQKRLSEHNWAPPIEAIRVRMGMHAGTASERNGDYFGTTVNRAARVSAVGDGGQILVTDAVHSLVADDSGRSWRFRDLGEHRLQDLSRSERIWQLDATDAPAALARIGHRTSHGNLPPARTRVFGREDDLARLVDSVGSDRLVSLVGVGGVGKTTLAQSAARALQDDYPAGAWIVDLALINEAEGVVQAVAGSLGIGQRSDMSTLESVLDGLNTEPRLVVLDNAEHVIGAVAALVNSILDNVSDIRIIVTSREPLAVDGETIHRIGPLPAGDDVDAPAVALFIERAKRVAPDLATSAFDPILIGEICERLDGLPLAIELAAAQCESMTPFEIHEAIAAHSLTLRSTSRSVTERHRSLSDMVAWSYERLGDSDQIVFARLAAFNAGCTTEAARFVCAGDGLDEDDVSASLRTLVRKSMIIPDRSAGSTRFTMLETLRDFSEARFSEMSDRQTVAARHAEWFARLSAEAREGMVGPDESLHLALLLADLGNVQKASRWACEHEEFDLMLRIGSCLPYLVSSWMRPDMLDWIVEALKALPSGHAARPDYAFVVAYHALFTGDLTGSTDTFIEATRGVDDREVVWVMQHNFSLVSALFVGDLGLVIEQSEEVAARAYDIGLVRVGLTIAADLALALFYTGNADRARLVAADVSAVADRSGNPSLLAWSKYLMGEIYADTEPSMAIDVLEDSVEYSITVDNEFVAGIALVALASTAGRHGDSALALDAMDRCIHLFWGAGNRPQLWTAIRNLVEILHASGMNSEALVLHAAAESDAEHAPEVFGPIGDRYRDLVEAVEDALGEQASAEALSRGEALGYGDAVEFALDSIARSS